MRTCKRIVARIVAEPMPFLAKAKCGKSKRRLTKYVSNSATVHADGVKFGAAIRASQCSDLEGLVPPEYHRGQLGTTLGDYDYVNPCWLRGWLDAGALPSREQPRIARSPQDAANPAPARALAKPISSHSTPEIPWSPILRLRAAMSANNEARGRFQIFRRGRRAGKGPQRASDRLAIGLP
jgi:hypothetical protein